MTDMERMGYIRLEGFVKDNLKVTSRSTLLTIDLDGDSASTDQLKSVLGQEVVVYVGCKQTSIDDIGQLNLVTGEVY